MIEWKALVDVKTQVERLGFNVWGLFLQGSQNYRMDTPMSDYDFKAVIIPDFDMIYNNTMVSETVVTKHGLVDIKDIRLFPELIMKGNISYVEILYTDVKFIKSNKEEFYALREGLIKHNMGNIRKSVYYTAKKKYDSMGKRTERNAAEIDSLGYEKKQLHHLARLEYVWRMLPDLEKGLIPTGSDRERILKLKTDPIPLDEALHIANSIMASIPKPDIPNELEPEFKVVYEALNDLVKRIVFMNVVSVKTSNRYVEQTHSHYKQLSKRHKEYLKEFYPEVGEEDFVDMLEYIDVELVNNWRIK